jgi:hypothetical protein
MATLPNQQPDDRELVTVFETMEESQAMVIRGLLESAEIDALIVGENAENALPVGGMKVLVPAEDADEARRIIAEYRANPPAEDSEPQA